MKIALFGVPGNMGSEVFKTLLKEDYIEEIRLLVFWKKGLSALLREAKKAKKPVKVHYGTVANPDDVRTVIDGVDYLLNMAAVIPPESDIHPLSAIEANEIGPKVITKVIEELGDKQPKFIHISTIGTYGDRNWKHPFAEVGDPLVCSPFDLYALTKVRGEFTVLESNVRDWVVIRQDAMFYDKILMKNVSDGLMFHTCFNTPLEWSTSRTSALLIRNILRRDRAGDLNDDNFWHHCFNIGGGEESRITGYDTFDLGFRIIGCKVSDFLDVNYNSSRNFHGSWYSDGYKLNDLFDYQHETAPEFWQHVADTHKYFKLAKICPKKLMKAFVTKPLLKSPNAPYYWNKHHDEAKMLAYFGGSDKFAAIDNDWSKFPVLSHGKTPDGQDIDFAAFRAKPTRLEHFFDIDKGRKEVTIEDLRAVAEAHGGKLLTEDFAKGDIFRKVRWQNADGEEFEARPHSILFCGHWFNLVYKEYAWDFDRQAKFDKIVANIWYDSHDPSENRRYWYDENFAAHYEDLK